eukprot:1891682-Alexandrium_andersonii.AAC.1
MERNAAVHFHRRGPCNKGRREARLLRLGGTATRTEGNGPAEQATAGQVLRVGDRSTAEAREVLLR